MSPFNEAPSWDGPNKKFIRFWANNEPNIPQINLGVNAGEAPATEIKRLWGFPVDKRDLIQFKCYDGPCPKYLHPNSTLTMAQTSEINIPGFSRQNTIIRLKTNMQQFINRTGHLIALQLMRVGFQTHKSIYDSLQNVYICI